MNQPLQLFLFGSPQITYQGQPLTGFVSGKVRALLIYLAMTDRPQSRDHLAELLWADTPASTRMNLRKALSNLRQLIGNILVEEGKESITLDTQQLWVDVVEFGQLLKQGADQDARELYQADFLTGFNLSLSYEFEAWVLSEQSHLKTQMVDLLRRLATYHEARHTLGEAILAVRRLLDLEPWHEEAHCWLMTLLAKDDQRSAALAHFEVCKRALQAELAVEPADETLALVEQIRQQPPLRPRITTVTATDTAHDNKVLGEKTSVGASFAIPTNLSMQLMPLLGREEDQRRIVELLTGSARRLVTLVGPPGMGKTRLGLAVAQQLRTAFAHGVHFVPLAAITDAELVASTMVSTLGLTVSGQQEPQATLRAFLRDKAMLLLLDNFEQLMDATALVVALLEECPHLHLLITSRERLHLQVEQIYRVPGLALSAAITLFVQRVQAVDADFALTPDNEGIISELCQHLDCLPLAIELSAAQVELLTLPDLLTRVRQQRLQVLRGGSRNLPERQRTLRSAIESSYNLLNQHEKVLFRTLGICVGSFDQAAVEGLGFDVATLQSLIHKSLVQVSTPNKQTRRFLLLETLREYALDQLAQAGEATAVAQRHADYYLHFAEEAETHLQRADQAEWLERLALDHDNLRAALRWASTNLQWEIGARFGIALWRFWDVRGHYAEGLQWLRQMVAEDEQPNLRAKLLYGQGQLAAHLAKYDLAIESFAESLSLFRKLNDPGNTAWALQGMGLINEIHGSEGQAKLCYDEALLLFRQWGDPEGIASTLDRLDNISSLNDYTHNLIEESLALRRQTGNLRGLSRSLSRMIIHAMIDEDWTEARRYQHEQLYVSEQIGDQSAIAMSLCFSGMIAFAAGEYEVAKEAFEKGWKICYATGEISNTYPIEWLGRIALKAGDYDQAQHLFEQAMPLHQARNDAWGIALIVGCFASLAAFRGKVWRALCLVSSGVTTCETFDIQLNKLDREVYDHAESEARRLLSSADAAAAWSAGRVMTREQAIEYAMNSSQEIIPGQATIYG